jgi:exodeoxyribonuclease VII large subunit
VEFTGVGELLLKLHERKKLLESRGWFDPKRKKTLPKHPKVIGVVTSPTGSVIQDILHVLSRRFSGFQLLLNPVKVQGEGAAEEIALAIAQMNQYRLADVLIVGRGGGSLEDLWAFNEEVVAKAIFESNIPIVTAIGHETDTCIADYVADVRAPTPSAAAEIVVSEKAQKLEFISAAGKNLSQMLRLKIKAETLRLKGFQRQPLFSSATLLFSYLQKIDDRREDLDSSFTQHLREMKLHLRRMQEITKAFNPSYSLLQQKNKMQSTERALLSQWQSNFRQKRQNLKQLQNHLFSLHPKNILTKGYCILFRENTNSVIVSKHDIQSKEKFDVLLADGTVKVEAL